jgi:SAM-dependent methyltransferase
MDNRTAMVKSPLTNGTAKLMDEFEVSEIVDNYKNLYQINVSEVFKGLKKVELYKCLQSGYGFYYPFTLAGNDTFYKQLSVFDWYYLPWKWEHEQSMPFVKNAKSILEIGCGAGAFLKTIQQRLPENEITGLEITTDADKEPFILNESIEEHALQNEEKYDLVCFYQVLEHISNPNSFLHEAIKVLKKGGILIISVPNNNTIFLHNNREAYLNFPPHHMGLWNKESLEYLTKQFPLELTDRLYEPIQDYHFEWFKSVLKRKIKKIKFPLMFRFSENSRCINTVATILRPFYKGHSIMFVYKKL